MSLTEMQALRITLSGTPGAIVPGDATMMRITAYPSSATIATVAADGSFSAQLGGVRLDTIYLELLLPDEDLFLMAVTGAAGDSVIDTAPGPDRDSDGSPDAIDCAPDDGTLGGRRCPPRDPATCIPLAEICGDGIDDDCDTVPDDGCRLSCTTDADCPGGGGRGEPCCGGVCSDVFSDPSNCGTCGNVCGGGLSCSGGACSTCGPPVPEMCGNGLDDDCDGAIDETC
jgi:hypothetical protein